MLPPWPRKRSQPIRRSAGQPEELVAADIGPSLASSRAAMTTGRLVLGVQSVSWQILYRPHPCASESVANWGVAVGLRAGWGFEDWVVANSYRPVDRGQAFLLPPDMADWLPEDHLVWFLIDAVEAMDTSGFHAGRVQAG